MAWTKLVSMELDDEDKIDMAMPVCNVQTQPDYPWGLRITFTERELEKLGITEMPDLGDMIDLRCFARVTSVSATDTNDGKQCRIEMQIENVALEDEMDESED